MAYVNHKYFDNKCALLEPLALEPVKVGVFDYAIDSGTTKYLIASFLTRLNGAGRLEARNIAKPLALCGVNIQGTASLKSTACILNPLLPTYTNAHAKYYDRLKFLDSTPPKQINFTDGLQVKPMLCGAYGAIILNVTYHDLTWIAAICNGGGWNLWNEIDDKYTFRNGTSYLVPVSKLTINSMDSGNVPNGIDQVIVGSQPPTGTVLYVLLPKSYGSVIDNQTYEFRDDFMESELDPAIWNKIENVSGNIQIDTQHQWLKLTGTTSWNTNSIYTKQSFSRVAGKSYIIDIFHNITTGIQPEGVFGWTDGLGYDYTNFVHGLNFANSSITFFESGTIRTSGHTYTNGCSYRIRITLKSDGATYEIQGGTEYPSMGSNSWTDISPAGSVGTTSTLYAGMSPFDKSMWVSDLKIY